MFKNVTGYPKKKRRNICHNDDSFIKDYRLSYLRVMRNQNSKES